MATSRFIEISKLVEELAKGQSAETDQIPQDRKTANRDVIVAILAKAADDFGFLSRLAENPGQVLKDYDLSQEEKAALISGDLQRIESWVGKLDKRLSTWPLCRLSQEKW